MSAPADYVLYDRFRRFIGEEDLIRPGQKIVAAISGGVDSTVLLDLLRRYGEELQNRISIAHVNHGLRGAESDADQRFVEDLGRTHGIPVFTVLLNDLKERSAGEGRSLQEVARILRYDFFEKVRRDTDSELIATGHNADDNAETVFFNFLRGTGLEGLAGIAVRRGNIIRPLLFVQRSQILEYAASRGLVFREDSSNRKSDYSRNIIRNEIFPLIESKLRAQITPALTRTAELGRILNAHLKLEVDGFLSAAMDSPGDNEYTLNLRILQVVSPAIRLSALKRIAETLTKSGTSYERIKAISELPAMQSGSIIQIDKDYIAVREPEVIRFRKAFGDEEFCMQIVPDRDYHLNDRIFSIRETSKESVIFSVDSSIEFIDAEDIKLPLTLRSRRPGDVFVPLGMQRKKKVSDFLTDRKIPLSGKYQKPILESDGKIVWICGLRIDDRFRIGEKTTKIYRLEFRKPAY